ncbi:transmembrane protein 192-like isoform X1 [Mytilus californianus]|uniref:transmembrane protein 192-like isoform X1 n=1 Tax=Mytilus californianus TaxID=6549 RepID=UPI0022466826|nr:transmembrane protein 192-like isoform X1 [Mytilus californianus]
MVSLSNESRHTGGYFFNEDGSGQNKDTEDLLSESPALSAELDPPFRKIHIVWAIVVEILLFTGLVIATFVLPHISVLQPDRNATKHDGKHLGAHVDEISVACYVHGGLWFVLLGFDRYLRYHHYRHRMCGYLEFYRRTRHLRKIPLMANSAGNAALLIVLKLLQNLNGTHTDLYIEIVIALEAVVAVSVLLIYLVKTVKFNSLLMSPDVAQDEMISSFMQNSGTSEIGFSFGCNDIGFKDENYSDQVLEKQADMIRYLKQHNSQLGRRILALTAENNALKSQISQS